MRSSSTFLSSQQSLASISTAAEEQKQFDEEERLLDLLRKSLPPELSSYFFQDGDEEYDHYIQLWKRLLAKRKVRNFRKGDVLVHKSKPLNSLVIIVHGLVRATDNTAGGRSYEDLLIGPGTSRSSFGWQSVLKIGASMNKETSGASVNNPPLEIGSNNDETALEQRETSNNNKKYMTGTIRAETNGQAIVVSKKSFAEAFSHLSYSNEHNGDRHYHHDGRPLLIDVADLRLRR